MMGAEQRSDRSQPVWQRPPLNTQATRSTGEGSSRRISHSLAACFTNARAGLLLTDSG
jgi:hypothetical protein